MFLIQDLWMGLRPNLSGSVIAMQSSSLWEVNHSVWILLAENDKLQHSPCKVVSFGG